MQLEGSIRSTGRLSAGKDAGATMAWQDSAHPRVGHAVILESLKGLLYWSFTPHVQGRYRGGILLAGSVRHSIRSFGIFYKFVL